LLQQTKR